MTDLTKYLILAVVIAVVFGLLWYQGYLERIRHFYRQTVEELRKCTWPTWDELKGSTVVIMLSVALLGGFTIATDWLLTMIFFRL